MAHGSKKMALLLAGTAAIALAVGMAPASAAPLTAPRLDNPTPIVEPPRRPGGWSTYFGFVPYAKGDFEVQALQRLYPQTNWPPSMRAWTPQSGF